jgi:hypothetical protein
MLPGDALDAQNMRVRFAGADWLRWAALLSIILFHVVLADAQFAKTARSPGAFDGLLVASAIFDNRSLAILSFFLLFLHHDSAPYGETIARRARRLLLPYLAWTSIYPLLNLGLALLKGESQAYIAEISRASFWLSGYFLAATTPHLHFLPTLLVLTLFYPFYRMRLPLTAAIALLAVTSALRTTVEFFVIGEVYAPDIHDLVLLSAGRILEYLPLGIFAFGLLTAAGSGGIRWQIAVASIAVLVAASILLKPAHLIFLFGETGHAGWLIVQAALGTVAMCLAAQLALSIDGGSRHPVAESIRPMAFGIFLLHPFFIDTFDAIVGAPAAYGLSMVVPKFLFALACSFLATAILVQTKGLRAIV